MSATFEAALRGLRSFRGPSGLDFAATAAKMQVSARAATIAAETGGFQVQHPDDGLGAIRAIIHAVPVCVLFWALVAVFIIAVA